MGPNNEAQGNNSSIGGGSLNKARGVNSVISGGIQNIIENSCGNSTIGGGGQNLIINISQNATISGGSGNTINGASTDSTISGGNNNNMTGHRSTIAGGFNNTIIASDSSIGGGSNNQIEALNACIGGGYENVIQELAGNSTIGGGNGNIIQNLSAGSCIPGGLGLLTNNTSAAEASFACGRYNVVGALDGSERVFMVGRGDSDTRSNIFSVTAAGVVRSSGGVLTAAMTADFGEYFESKNGKSIPIGTPVVMSEYKRKGLKTIRACRKGEIPFGVISNTAGFVCNEGEEWHGKYERDEYGNIVYCEVEIKTKDGCYKTIGPKISKDFDPTKKFIPRCERPEWNLVGLLGQVKILKGSITNPNWICMGDCPYNDKYEMWLIK